MKLSSLEPFGIFALASGLLYSLTVAILGLDHYRLHFIVLTLLVFIALFCISAYKYLKYKYTCENMDVIMQCLRRKTDS